MAAIDMPATPANPSTYKASNGVTYVWDGQKWSATGGGGQTGKYKMSRMANEAPILIAVDPSNIHLATTKSLFNIVDAL